MLFPNFKAFVCTDTQTPNSKFINEVESNLPLQYLLKPKGESENIYCDPKPTFPTALIQPDSDRTVT